MSDRPTKCKVLDITGRLPKPALKSGQAVLPPEQVRVDPTNDMAIDLTLKLMDVINEEDWEALHILLALNLLSRTIYAELIQRFGRRDFLKLAGLAQKLAQEYEPVFHERRDDDGEGQAGPEGADAS